MNLRTKEEHSCLTGHSLCFEVENPSAQMISGAVNEDKLVGMERDLQEL